MRLEQLSLAQYRGFEQIDLLFESDVTLIAGVNGVGKSSVLSAIATVLSRTMPQFTSSRSTPIHFSDDDIHNDKVSLEVSLQIDVGKHFLNAGIQRVRDSEKESDRFVLLRQDRGSTKTTNFADALRARTLTGEIEVGMKETQAALQALKTQENQPLAVYFTPKRQLPGQPRSLPVPKPFDVSQAYSRALHDRDVELREFMHWFRTQETLADEGDRGRHKVLDTLRKAVTEFVPEFTALHIQEEPKLALVVEKDGSPLYLHQLSDGERGILALVFDLARRLAIVNPESENPLAEGKAIVMIDEIELHLHPKWQRQVIRRFQSVFANCQFVITTHSPQVIGQVRPEKLRFLYFDDNGKVAIEQLSQSFGMDSSWILQNIMGVPARDYETEQRLLHIYDLIDGDNIAEAKTHAASLRQDIGEFPELQEVTALIDRLELLGAHEED